jgi:predicted nucleic acid-binding protein
MSSLVVDASAAMKWFFPEDHSAAAERLLDDRFRLHAPDFLLLEADSVVFKRVRRNEIDRREGAAVRAAVRRMPIQLHRFEPLVDPAYEIAVGLGCGVYDGLYVALAELIDGTVATADARLRSSVRGTPLDARVTWIDEIA